MDFGRLPASNFLRPHPYPRVKASTRERVVASTWGDEQYFGSLSMDVLHIENETPFMLYEAIHKVDAETQLRHRRLSMSSLVVDLALMVTKKT